MKAAQTKTPAATAATKSAPFFNKNGAQDFFAPAQEQPFFSKTIQPKLTIGKPNDPYEREADAMADKVVQRLAEPAPAKTTTPAAPAVQACAACDTEEKVQEKPIDAPPEKISRKAIFESNEDRTAQRKPLAQAITALPKIISPAPALQAKCSECEQEEKKDTDKDEPEKIQKKAIFESNEERPVQRKEQPSVKAANTPTLQLQCNDCEQEEKLQKKEDTAPKEITPQPIAEAREIKRVQAKAEPTLTPPVKSIVPTLAAAPAVQACSACETEEKKGEEEEGDTQGPQIRRKPVFDTNPADGIVQRSCRECEEGPVIFRKAMIQLSTQQSSGDGSREGIVTAAKGEIGKVQAKQDDGGGKRIGADRLLEYFHVAAPGVWDDSIIETAGAQMPSWCGIFSVWAHKKAGKDIGNWQMGRGVSAFHTLTTTDNPQTGDIGYIDKPYQHHCIIERVDGDTIHSIDGNSGLFSEVIRNERPRSAYSGFFTAFGGVGGDTVQTKSEESVVQASAKQPVASPSVEQSLSSSKGGGQALPEATRSGMEQNFGTDFSSVKVHTDSSAVQMNKDLHAQAFTHGSDIYFNSGKYDTGSTGGRHLLAHELTHVVQQGSAPQSVRRSPEPATIETEAPAPIEQKAQAPAIATKPDIQKDDPPPAPGPDANAIAQTVYDALDGWTSSADSANILAQLRNQNKATTDVVIPRIGQLSGETSIAVFRWMKGDMVSSDWHALRDHFIRIRVQDAEAMIADNIYDLMTGYTSEEDSRDIVNLFTGEAPIGGDQMTSVLSELCLKTDRDTNGTVAWLFGDMTNLDADRLCTHFFRSGSMSALNAASYWRAKNVRDLIAGWTSAGDSTMIVTNFERTPPALREHVLFDLDTMCQAEWSKRAYEILQDDMYQTDYELLRGLVPSLPVWNVERSWLGWIWQGISTAYDYVEGLIEYVVCGVFGTLWGILLIVRDFVVLVWDLLRAVRAFLGWILHMISSSLAREESESFREFFHAMGQFFHAPGEAISLMWSEMVQEGALITGPFRACRQAFYWMTRVGNFLGNLILILVGGYGLAKLAAEGIEGLVIAARSGKLLQALGNLGGRLTRAIIRLPLTAGRAITDGVMNVVRLVGRRVEVMEAVSESIAAIRAASASQGYYNFLREQAGLVADAEGAFWRRRRAFWQRSADAGTEGLDAVETKLTQAVDTVVDDPANAEALVNEAEADTATVQREAAGVRDEIDGTAPPTEVVPDFESRLPEQWRTGAPNRPGMLTSLIAKFRAQGLSEDVIIAIIQRASAAGGDGALFIADLYQFSLFGQGRLGATGYQAVIDGLSSAERFDAARMIMRKVSVSRLDMIRFMQTYSLQDVATLRAAYPGGSETDFLNNLRTIAESVDATAAEIATLLHEAGEGDSGMNKMMEAVNNAGPGRHTPAQMREQLDFTRALPAATDPASEDLARSIWGENYQGRDPETGKFRVSASLTDTKAGDEASSFISRRIRQFVNRILGGGSGTEIDAQQFAIIRDSIRNTDLPVSVQNSIIGQVWGAASVQRYKNLGWNVIEQVRIYIRAADGTLTRDYAVMDAVMHREGQMVYKEFKSSLSAATTKAQTRVYGLLEEGNAARLSPSGPNAEAAFGGPDMPGFRAQPVSYDRPPSR